MHVHTIYAIRGKSLQWRDGSKSSVQSLRPTPACSSSSETLNKEGEDPGTNMHQMVQTQFPTD
jgi:hypothetical protein